MTTSPHLTEPPPGTGEPAGHPAARGYAEVHDSVEFARLRARFLGFVFPLAGAFLLWYFLYVLLSVYAPGLMGYEVLGNINVGLLFGLAEFVSTVLFSRAYVRFASTSMDPQAERLRREIEWGRP